MTILTELTRVIYLSGDDIDGPHPQCPWCTKPRSLDSELCNYCGYYISLRCAGVTSAPRAVKGPPSIPYIK